MPSEPRATYRVQLHKGFGFEAAATEVEYLDRLGISHLYTSPVLQAAPGSTHGYDVVDHSKVNAELGGEAGFARLSATLRARGMGQLLDIVPNHMAIVTPHNLWWWDVLENGPSSRYAAYFDVDWDPPEAKLRNTVLLPALEDQYGRVLEKKLLGVARRDDGTFTVSGQVDRLAVSKREVLIVDYKTNRPPPASASAVALAYRRQLALYRTLLAGIYPGRTVRAFLLWTAAPLLMEIDAETLEKSMPYASAP